MARIKTEDKMHLKSAVDGVGNDGEDDKLEEPCIISIGKF